MNRTQRLLRPQPTPAPRGRTGLKRILVVDDNVDVRIMLEHFFRAYGYQVTVCSDGEEALAVLHGAGPFDLIVLDLMMPGLSGYDLLRELRRSDPGSDPVPIVILSAVQMPFVSGVQAVFQKPAPLMDLLASVQTLIGASSGPPDNSDPLPT